MKIIFRRLFRRPRPAPPPAVNPRSEHDRAIRQALLIAAVTDDDTHIQRQPAWA